MPVGVDAHIDPAVRDRKIAQTIGENAHRLVGADDPVRPLGNNKFAVTYRKKRNIPRPYANLAVVANHPNCAILRVSRAGRCGHRPLQTWCVFAGVHSFLWVRPAGRGRTPPLRLDRECNRNLRQREGQAPRLRYDETWRRLKNLWVLIPSGASRHRLAAARSRRGSDSPPGCHSTPRRRFATLVTKGRLNCDFFLRNGRKFGILAVETDGRTL